MSTTFNDLQKFETEKEIISSASTGAKSKKEVLDSLTKANIPNYLTEKGDLWIKAWQVIEDFVTPEQAAVIRTTQLPEEQSDELDWLSENLESVRQDFGGQWIAVSEERIVASDSDLTNLMDQIDQYDSIFITFIPTDQIVWTITYAS